jgi:hypothetical protein
VIAHWVCKHSNYFSHTEEDPQQAGECSKNGKQRQLPSCCWCMDSSSYGGAQQNHGGNDEMLRMNDFFNQRMNQDMPLRILQLITTRD